MGRSPEMGTNGEPAAHDEPAAGVASPAEAGVPSLLGTGAGARGPLSPYTAPVEEALVTCCP